MRSMWNGAVAFGLVNIPVKLYAATEQHDISFRQVRRSDGSRVRYKRVAEADGEEVQYGEIAKGYELPTGEMLILTDEDLAQLPLPTKKVIDVLQFVPLEQVDPIMFNKSYFLEPEKQGLKPYVLMRDALRDSGLVAVVKVTIGTREQVATLRVRDDILVLATMLWPDEIRTPSFAILTEDAGLRPQETAMASSLINSMSGDYVPEEFTDHFTEAMSALIDAKIGGAALPAPTKASSGADVGDLLATLQRSIDASTSSRTSDRTQASKKAPAAKAPAKRGTAAKKAPAAKTTPVKKIAAKAPSRTAAKKAAAKAADNRIPRSA